VSRIFCWGKRNIQEKSEAATTTAAVRQSTDGIQEILVPATEAETEKHHKVDLAAY